MAKLITLKQVAAKNNICGHKTMREYGQLKQLPRELKTPPIYRTQPDAFEEDRSEVVGDF
jgi:hypothetical protein